LAEAAWSRNELPDYQITKLQIPMSELYPFRLVPEFRNRPWGTRDLAPIYDKHVHPGEEPIGEVWLTGDDCRVANGPLAGASVMDLCRRFGREFLGSAAENANRFPLLIKFLFPRDKLSVQVHPDDEGARRLGQPCGKTECWYVLDAEPGAQVGLGLKPGTTRAQFEQAIGQTRAEELLNWLEVRPGELIYVDAGTVHAIGPGSILVETQQNSDTTYRLYDYGRPRELHIREGLQALKEQTSAGKVKLPPAQNGRLMLVASPCFLVEKFSCNQTQSFAADGASVQCLVAIGGCGVVESAGMEPLSFARGDVVVIPASASSFSVRPQWAVDFLRMMLPSSAVPIPATTLY
jgi:mannose-6-phosphate isomerase